MIDELDKLPTVAGSEWCRLVGEVTLGAFVKYVQEQHDGTTLTPDKLASFVTAFQADRTRLSRAYEQMWHTMDTARMEAEWANRRHQPLLRLLVQRFEHHLEKAMDRRGNNVGAARLARAMLPGFIAAMTTMVPGDLWEAARKRCDEIVSAVHGQHGDAFRWTQVYDSLASKQEIDNILMSILVYFDNLEKRCHWFIGVVDRHYVGPDGPGPDGLLPERERIFSDDEFYVMLAALYHDLGARVHVPNGREVMVRRYGQASVDRLTALVDTLTAKMFRANVVELASRRVN